MRVMNVSSGKFALVIALAALASGACGSSGSGGNDAASGSGGSSAGGRGGTTGVGGTTGSAGTTGHGGGGGVSGSSGTAGSAGTTGSGGTAGGAGTAGTQPVGAACANTANCSQADGPAVCCLQISTCVLDGQCPGSPTYVSCEITPCAKAGWICCNAGGMHFCTKQSGCPAP